MDVNRLKDLLQSKKINQRELADKIGYTQTAISQAISRGDFKVSMLEKIADVLEVPMNYFFVEKNRIEIKGQVHNGTGDNVSIDANQELLTENEILKEKVNGLIKENEGLKNQIELLREMNEILKNK